MNCVSGDRRCNQNTQLTVLQIILLREHNRIAHHLQHINPHWDDETLYQEARRILIAEYQHINYYEWLPIFLGMLMLISVLCVNFVLVKKCMPTSISCHFKIKHKLTHFLPLEEFRTNILVFCPLTLVTSKWHCDATRLWYLFVLSVFF